MIWLALTVALDGVATTTSRPGSDGRRRAGAAGGCVAEVDGNRTRLTGIACHARFEGGGAHQEPRHLQTRT